MVSTHKIPASDCPILHAADFHYNFIYMDVLSIFLTGVAFFYTSYEKCS